MKRNIAAVHPKEITNLVDRQAHGDKGNLEVGLHEGNLLPESIINKFERTRSLEGHVQHLEALHRERRDPLVVHTTTTVPTTTTTTTIVRSAAVQQEGETNNHQDERFSAVSNICT